MSEFRAQPATVAVTAVAKTMPIQLFTFMPVVLTLTLKLGLIDPLQLQIN